MSACLRVSVGVAIGMAVYFRTHVEERLQEEKERLGKEGGTDGLEGVEVPVSLS